MIVNKKKLESVMNKKTVTKYELFGLLDISESSFHRWMREGWPQIAFLALCSVLNVKEKEIQ